MQNYMMNTLKGLIIFNIVLFPVTAFAYIGPGAGLSAIGSLLALLSAILFAIFGFLWYPLKRLKQKLMKKKPENSNTDTK